MNSVEQTSLLPALCSQGVGFYCLASKTKNNLKVGKIFVLIVLLLYV